MPPWTTRPRGPDQDRLVIGRFARLTGLSVGALRHYDELDLLRPRWVDPDTGYRSYRRDQLETARTIVRLRDLELPLEEIRAYLGTDDPAERRRILIDHRRRIEARTFRLQGVLHVVGQLAGATARPDRQGDPADDRPDPRIGRPTSMPRPIAASASPCSTTSGRCSSSRIGRPPRWTR